MKAIIADLKMKSLIQIYEVSYTIEGRTQHELICKGFISITFFDVKHEIEKNL